MSPLLHAIAGSGACGNWSEMIITAWTDGRVIALDIDNGNPIWESQTEVVTGELQVQWLWTVKML